MKMFGCIFLCLFASLLSTVQSLESSTSTNPNSVSSVFLGGQALRRRAQATEACCELPAALTDEQRCADNNGDGNFNKECTFPFTFNGAVYTGCTTDWTGRNENSAGFGEAWCSLTSTFSTTYGICQVRCDEQIYQPAVDFYKGLPTEQQEYVMYGGIGLGALLVLCIISRCCCNRGDSGYYGYQ